VLANVNYFLFKESYQHSNVRKHEFARKLETQGRSAIAAAVQASRLRLRPILMTSIAFVAGVIPLVFCSGAGAEMRHAMGIAVLFGMLGVTFFGVVMTPVFYVALRALSGRRPFAHHGATGADDTASLSGQSQ